MPTSRRLFVPLDVRYFDDPKLMEACERSAWNEVLFCRALAIAKDAEHDGMVSRAELLRARVPALDKRLADLVDVGVLTVVHGGWSFKAWLKHNLSNEQIAEHRETNAQRQRRFRLVAGNASHNALPTGSNNAPRNGARNALQGTSKGPSTKHEVLSAQVATQPSPPGTSHRQVVIWLAKLETPNIGDQGEGLTGKDWSRLGDCAKTVLEATPNVDRAEVGRRWAEYIRRNPGAAKTANALASWWTRVGATERPPASGFGVGQRSSAS